MSEIDESRTWVFARGSLSAQEIQGVVDEVLAEMLAAPESDGSGDAVVPPGPEVVDLTALEERTLDLRRTMRVRPSGQGNVPDATEIIIEIGQGLAVKFAWDLWTTRIWPRLTRKAADAIGPRRGAHHRRQ